MTLRGAFGWLMVLLPIATVAALVRFPNVALGIFLGQMGVGVLFPLALALGPRIVWPLCGRGAGVRLGRTVLLGAMLVPAARFAGTPAEPVARVSVGVLTVAFGVVLWALLDRAVRLERNLAALAALVPVGEGGAGVDAANAQGAARRQAEREEEENGWDWTGSGEAGFGGDFLSGGDGSDAGDGGGDGGD